MEKELDFDLVLELPWKRRHDFLVLNPAGTVPTLIEDDGKTICGNAAISEYLNEKYDTVNLIGESADIRTEVRRLTEWFEFQTSPQRHKGYEQRNKYQPSLKLLE